MTSASQGYVTRLQDVEVRTIILIKLTHNDERNNSQTTTIRESVKSCSQEASKKKQSGQTEQHIYDRK